MGVTPWALGDGTMTMEGIASLWGYQETAEELKQKLFYTTLELDSLQTNAKEQMRKNEERINQLIQLLKITCQERDEARDQLQILLKKLMPPNPVIELCPIASYLQPESPEIRQTKGNSSISESNSLSETHNHQSYVSSPVESFFDAATSPELSNFTMADSCHIGVPPQPLFQEFNNNSSTSIVGISSGIPKYDQASAKIDQLVINKALPEKGKLLQAVLEAGPLLQTLLVAGPLPRWRNPPPLQPLQIPPISVKGPNSQTLNQTAILSPNPLVQGSLNGLQHEKSQGGPQMHGIMGGLCVAKRPMASPCSSSYQSLSAKRQKSQ